MTFVSVKTEDFIQAVENEEKKIKKTSIPLIEFPPNWKNDRFKSPNSPGWLYDPMMKEWLKPASYEQLEIFKKEGFIEWGPAGCKPNRYVIRQRPV